MAISAYGALFDRASVNGTIRDAAKKAASYGKMRIKARTPVRTGQLRDAWNVKIEGYGVRITNEKKYAIFVEMGTRYMDARPMVAPTVDEIRKEFKRLLVKSVGKKRAKDDIGKLDEYTSATDPRDSEAYERLTRGRSNLARGIGFRNS